MTRGVSYSTSPLLQASHVSKVFGAISCVTVEGIFGIKLFITSSYDMSYLFDTVMLRAAWLMTWDGIHVIMNLCGLLTQIVLYVGPMGYSQMLHLLPC